MKRKASILLITSAMVLSACSWSDLMFWKKWWGPKKDNSPADTETDTNKEDEAKKNDVIAAFSKLETLDSFTAVTKAEMSGENEYTVGEHKVPSYQTISINYETKQVGNNTKINAAISMISQVNLQKAEAVEGVTKEETMSALVLDRNTYIMAGYDASLIFDLDKQEAIFNVPFMSSETYTIYDEEAKQTYDYEIGDDDVRYNYDDDDNGLIDTKSIIDVVKQGTVDGNTIHAVIDGENVDIKFELKDGYVSSLEAEVEGTHLTIFYSDFNKTSFAIPAGCHKPVCRWPHDSHTAYSYVKTETGHRKYCQECHKFLGEEKPHDHSHNDDGYCEICGYIDGQDNVDTKVVPGFGTSDDDYYLKAKVVQGVIVNSSSNYDYDFSCYESSSETNVNYKIYTSSGVVLRETTANSTKIEGACVKTNVLTYDLYKNLSESELNTIKALGYGSERTDALKAYLLENTVSATFSGKVYSLSHGVVTGNEQELDECHTIHYYTCPDCGEVTSAYIGAVYDHEAGFVETTQEIDDCHTQVNHDCPTCHEHNEEIQTHHVDGTPVVEEMVIDSCYTLQIKKCATCGDILSKEIVTNHTGHTSTRVVDDGHGGTKTLTICDSCHTVISIA